MNDHNLDDLIIDEVAPKKNKTKSLLTIFALLIVVFIVAIILTSVVLDDTKGNDPLLEENNTEMVSPELTLQSASQKKEQKEQTQLTEIIEEELNKPLSEPEVSKEPIPTENKPVDIPVTHKPIAPKPTPVLTSVPQTNVDLSTQTSNKVEVPKEAVAIQHNAPTVVDVPVISSASYYIQVGSFSKLPSTRLVSSIKNNGFNYKLTTPNAKGIKKLLIGPYESRPLADTAIVRVRDLINKSAFVVKK